jgi:nucleoside-diphosphate-sugar epimerase
VDRSLVEKPLVIVTGSSGLIGTRLLQQLVGQYDLVGLDVKPPPFPIAGTTWIPCDLKNEENVAQVFDEIRERHGQQVASVLHLAAYYDFSGEPSPLYHELTVEGSRRVLRQLRSFDVEQFIFSSTLLVMQPIKDGEPITEDSPIEAEWAYPQSKLEAEAAIRQAHADIPVVILRIAGVYDEDCHSLPLSQHISRIYEKRLEGYFFPGDSRHGQPLVHLDDLAACFARCIERRRELGPYEVFLVAEEDVMSYAELQDRLGELIHGRAWPTVRIPKTLAKIGAWLKDLTATGDQQPFIKPWMIDLADQHYPVSVDRSRQRLGWEPEHSLRDTLPEIIARLERDPRGWYRNQNLPLPATLREPREAPR